MRQATFTALSAALLALMASGCANQPGTSTVDRNFGTAVNAAKALQVADPDAPSRVRPAPGTDGEQARTAVEEYERSYTHPVSPTSVLNIGIGSGGSGGSGGSR